ncbi:MAG: CinA family protein [Acetobacter sp.]|nr:CinA family protein [Bacteroides sp.]MCM1340940.1 CinA family protein [Acetobacter sp.]MCM1432504.1 CinA family protein [Clostridiales bacterium]
MALEERLAEKLIEKNYHISFAESCTGGLCCGTLVNVTNASKILDVSFVTYANEAKMKFLGVSANTILSNGVVSEEVAYEMAEGVAKTAESDIGVGITGIAGPGGSTDKKPVGMVCFGFYIQGKTITFTKQFGEIGRNQVRKSSVEFVFQTLLELID